MQKKWLIFVLLLLLAVPARAQWSAGGRVSINGNVGNGSFGMTLRPDVSYTFKDIAVGINGIAEFDRFNSNNSTPETIYKLGLAPYIQYFFFRIGQFSFFLDGGLEVSRFASNVVQYWSFIPYIGPGLEISLTEHWTLQGTFGRLDYNSYSRTINFYLDGSAFSAGLYYSF